jgi:hypothetical protein
MVTTKYRYIGQRSDQGHVHHLEQVCIFARVQIRVMATTKNRYICQRSDQGHVHHLEQVHMYICQSSDQGHGHHQERLYLFTWTADIKEIYKDVIIERRCSQGY